MKTLIKQLPAWIRHTNYCPLKAAGLPADYFQYETAKDYFTALHAWGGILSKEIKAAVKFAAKEQQERTAFRPIYESAPLSIRGLFPKDVWQTAQGRAAFVKRLTLPAALPEGFGVRNAPPEHKSQRKVFKPKLRTLKRQPVLKATPPVQTRHAPRAA